MNDILDQFRVASPSCDTVMHLNHPDHTDGGPCDGCAFRNGAAGNQSEHTVILARLSVEGFRHFHCHQHPGLCRGFVAAINLRGVPQDDEERARCAKIGAMADLFNDAIYEAKTVDEAAMKPRTPRKIL